MSKINHNFGSRSTAEQVARNVNLSGKTAIVTGANGGMGKEIARVFAKLQARVIVACRDQAKCDATESELRNRTGNENIHGMVLDLGSLESVRAFAREFNSKNYKLDILINNGGVMGCPYMKTVDGFEMQFGTNYLGHFLLTNLLLDSMGDDTRIVNVTSKGHKMYGTRVINFDDLQSEKNYDKMGAYGQSKLALVLFARELDHRYKERGILAFSVHPGVVAPTNSLRYFPSALGWVWNNVVGIFLKSVSQGSATQVYLSTAPKEVIEPFSGKYFLACNVGTTSAAGNDDEMAHRLWEVSTQLVGLN